ncbi:MAG: threonylcarbamoyl-AMP synthase [Acholeplasmatales bacterium]|nr:threonylcarbamoyl-AMP synthase [Acholeplasmatales bacterium]
MSKVLIFPTDTVYGIGTPIDDLEGIKRIYSIKNRPLDKPLACLCDSLEQIQSIAIVDSNALKLIEKLLPGPLTIILKAKPEIKQLIGYDTIGVRIPKHRGALTILHNEGPMLTTSVNDSGNVPLNEYDEICEKYSHLVDHIYNTVTKSSNISSTVVYAVDGKLEILREGEITIDRISEALNV